MLRWRASVLAGLGVAGLTARGDDFGWRPAGSAPGPAVLPVAIPAQPVPVYGPSEPSSGGWQPVGRPSAAVPSTPDDFPSEPVFRPASAPLYTSQPVPIPVPVAPAYQFPVVMVPAIDETLPLPRTLPGSGGAAPKPDAPPAPKAEAGPVAAPPSASQAATDSSRIWGGYGSLPPGPYGEVIGEPVVMAGGPKPPIRHRTFGSEDVSISRDYHFLDSFGTVAGQEARAERRAMWEASDGPATDRFLIQTEYLLWWVQPAKIPVLATTGTPESMGFLGRPGTQLLLGPGSFGNTARNGFRIRGGWWFDNHLPGKGIDASYFFLGNQSSSQSFNSNQFPVITRPFFAPNNLPDTGLPGEFGERVASPGRSTGVLAIDNNSELWGADINMKCCICRTCNYQSAWFGGFRFLGLNENLTITENIISGAGNFTPPGTAIVVQDSFGVRNRFYGPQVGYMIFRRFGRVTLDGRGSLALGVTNQELNIAGSQQVQFPGQVPLSFNGGLLAVGPNLGKFRNDAFSVVPEITMNVGYQLTPTLRAYVGYNFLYWTNVIRPGDQIDRVVDLSFVPNSQMMNGQPVPFSGQNRPRAAFNESDLWIQGVQLGAELRW